VIPDGTALVIGFGVTGQAVARRLRELGRAVLVVEDHPRDDLLATAESIGVELVASPDDARLRAVVSGIGVAFPSPGIPDRHPSFAALAEAGVPVRSEFDLSAELDDRPVVAITGTDGKTTVTTMVTGMLEASGVATAAAGNTETPLVDAIRAGGPEVFVVEASSFRLRDTHRFVPAVATWLNFGADHQDVHTSAARYEASKARLWADLGADQVAVANADDAVVRSHVRPDVPTVLFGRSEGDYRLEGDLLVGDGDALVAVDELSRSLPHDIANGLAAAATARRAGASLDGVRAVLRTFEHLPHRVQLVAEAGGIRYVDDSKATTPHASLAAVHAFDSVVLIAGGRNKGLDLAELRAGAPRLRAVVGLGEAAGEVHAAFDGIVPVEVAGDMDEAVGRAASLARPGDVVLLSPACASFDQYRSYAERGDDFARIVHARLGLDAGATS
jgi:UDP-N-acetylmuramoylalanine--D-glutamate ligase